jgi:hypothetical protein
MFLSIFQVVVVAITGEVTVADMVPDKGGKSKIMLQKGK